MTPYTLNLNIIYPCVNMNVESFKLQEDKMKLRVTREDPLIKEGTTGQAIKEKLQTFRFPSFRLYSFKASGI